MKEEINSPLNDLDVRSSYAKQIKDMFRNNGINWIATAPATRAEIFIRQNTDYEWQNFPAVSRISLQIKENEDAKRILSFGVSGYFPARILNTYQSYSNLGYEYHDKDGNSSPQDAVRLYKNEDNPRRPRGRWWLTKKLDNLESLTKEIRDIEPLLSKQI